MITCYGLKRKHYFSCHLLLLSYCSVSSIPFLSLMAGDISVFHNHFSFFGFFFGWSESNINAVFFFKKTFNNTASDVAGQRDRNATRTVNQLPIKQREEAIQQQQQQQQRESKGKGNRAHNMPNQMLIKGPILSYSHTSIHSSTFISVALISKGIKFVEALIHN